MLKKILYLFFFLILFVSLTTNLFFYQKIKTLEEPNRVIKVVDGDTLILRNNQTIRLANLNAPDLQYCGGIEAKKRLEQLVLNKIINFESIGKDSFKRTVALVYINKILVNEIVLKEGLARYDGSPSPKREILKKAYDQAVNQKKGIFSLCVLKDPPNKNCFIKGNIDRHYSNKKHYFLPNCHEYPQVIVEKDLGEDWFCSEKQAQEAGFVKATNCP